MTKKYKLMRVPMEAVKGFQIKKEKMEKRVLSWTGKQVKIPMTKILIAIANNPVEIEERKVIKLSKKKIRRIKKCVL